MITGRIKLLTSVTIVILAAGWFAGQHYATRKAQDMIQGYLIRNDLSHYVTYSDISANIFGTATIYDVGVGDGSAINLTMKSVRISDLHYQDDQLISFTVVVHGLNLPTVSLAQGADLAEPEARQMLGLGYTSLAADFKLSANYDPGRGELTASSTGDSANLSSWRFGIRLDNIDQTLVYQLRHPTAGFIVSTMNDPSALIASAGRISLAEVDLSVDNSEFREREREIVDQEVPQSVPPDKNDPRESLELTGMRDDLVKAGMAPSDADSMTSTLASWYEDGGKISFTTHISQPLPLLVSGGAYAMDSGPRFAFDSPANFVVATNAAISR